MPPSRPTKVPISTGAIVGVVVGSIAFVSFLIGIGIFLCLRRRRSSKQTRGPPIDLDADEQMDEPHPSPSTFSPFEQRPPVSPREVSDYSRDSSAGVRTTGSPSSQALLFALDSTSNNTRSTYSMYSRDDSATSATQWGAKSPVRNTAGESYPPVRDKRRSVTTNRPEGASDPIAVNRLPSDVPSPPPYTARNER